MATSIRRRVILSAAALAALAAWSGTAQAQLIASDSYYIGSDPTLGKYNVGDLKQIGTGSGAQAAFQSA